MFFTIKKYGLTALMASMLIGCISHEDTLVIGEVEKLFSAKIINSPRSAEAGKLLVKFNEKATLAFESTKCSDVTRSNIGALNVALTNINAISIERLFPIDPRHEERTRKAGLHRWYVLSFDSEMQLEKAAQSLAAISDVDIVQYNSILSHNPSAAVLAEVGASTRLSVESVNDPAFKNQWHYYNTGSGIHENQVAGLDVNGKDAWQYCTGDASIIVAVIDEGVDYTHEDLKANMWVNKGEIADNGIDDDGNGYIDDVHGYNHCTGGGISWNASGDSGHGTHVAGTVAAVNNNGKGVCGVAGGDGSGNGVKIMSSQLFSGKAKGTAEVSARAFKYAADNGAVIAQCSWGYDANDGVPSITNDLHFKRGAGAEYDGILYFQSVKNSDVLDGGLVVFAAGNDGIGQSGYPGGYRDFISVASTGCDGMPAYYTNYGPGVNISAPGGDMKNHGNAGGVLSTMPNNRYGYMQGTSMACPHASGVAALGLSYAKQLGKHFSLEEFTSMFLLSTDNIDNYIATNEEVAAKYYGKMGTGSIDALRMLMNVEGTPCISVTKGSLNMIDLRPYLGDGTLDIVVRDNLDSSTIMSDEDKEKLGVTNGPRISSNKLIITCEKAGHGYINVSCVIGGKEPGSDDNMGGRVSTKRLAIIVRNSHATNGGWM